MNGLNKVKPCSTPLQIHIGHQTTKKTSGKNTVSIKKHRADTRTQEIITEVVKENPSKSMRKITKEMGTAGEQSGGGL